MKPKTKSYKIIFAVISTLWIFVAGLVYYNTQIFVDDDEDVLLAQKRVKINQESENRITTVFRSKNPR